MDKSHTCLLSFPSQGGVLLRVYTALVSPFHTRVVVVCGKKTTAAEAVQIALAKCGKSELDHKRYCACGTIAQLPLTGYIIVARQWLLLSIFV